MGKSRHINHVACVLFRQAFVVKSEKDPVYTQKEPSIYTEMYIYMYFHRRAYLLTGVRCGVWKRPYVHSKRALNPHEKLLGITWVSNPVTRKDLAARTWGVFWYSKIPVLFELMVHIKQKRGTGLKTPSPRSFWCGCNKMYIYAYFRRRAYLSTGFRCGGGKVSMYTQKEPWIYNTIHIYMYFHRRAYLSTGVRCGVWKRPYVHSKSALHVQWNAYGVATVSRLLKIIGLFCRISSLL